MEVFLQACVIKIPFWKIINGLDKGTNVKLLNLAFTAEAFR